MSKRSPQPKTIVSPQKKRERLETAPVPSNSLIPKIDYSKQKRIVPQEQSDDSKRKRFIPEDLAEESTQTRKVMVTPGRIRATKELANRKQSLPPPTIIPKKE